MVYAVMDSAENRYVSTISGMLENRGKLKRKKGGQKIRKYCREYCEYSGIHGLRYFGEKRSFFEKVCWVAVFVTSLLICIAVIYLTYKKWQHQPIMVNFSSDEKNINDIPFPAVTICREIRISRDFFNYSNILRKSVVDQQKLKPIDLTRLQYMSLLCGGDKIYKSRIPTIETINEDFYEFLLNGSKPFLHSCTWMGIKFNCKEIFRPIVTDEGLCYTFNMLENKDIFNNVSYIPDFKTNRRGLGLHSNIQDWSVDSGYTDDAQAETYPRRALLAGSTNALVVDMRINVDDIDYACTSFQGYQVVLHQPIRYPIVQIHYFRVPMRKAVIVAISPSQMMNSEEVNDYGVDKRECYLQGEKRLKFFKNYTQNNCVLECLANTTLTKCNCVAFFMPRERGSPICGNAKINCMKDVKNNMRMKRAQLSLNNNNYNECGCLPMCTLIEYNTEITEIEYDRHKEYESLGLKKPDENHKYAWSQLVIYFKNSYFIPHVRSELYGDLDFLANVGGLLGLFIGFSLLSLFEIIYFVSVRIICNMKMYKKWYGEHTQ